MTETLLYINNSIVNPPQNMKGFAIQLNYGKDQFPGTGTISIEDFEWVRENYDSIKQYIDEGLTGGVGIFEGIPLRIDVTDGIITKTVFDGYIDLTDNLEIKDRIKITSKVTNFATIDWLNTVAQSFTPEYLASLPAGTPGAITSDMYRFMPYVQNLSPNYEQIAITSLMIFSISYIMKKEINDLNDLLVEAGDGVNTLSAILKCILKIAYLTTLLLSLIKLIEDLVKYIISPVKYHAGMYVRDLLSKCAEHLNMTFKSDIFEPSSDYYNEFIIPEKFYNPISKLDNTILGFLVPSKNDQLGWYKGTFGQLLDAMKTKYNAKIIVTENREIILIRRDKNAQPPVYQLPDIYSPQYTYNTSELQANTLIEYQIDPEDTNTLQNYQGTAYQIICQPKSFNYRQFVMMKNYTNVAIPFSKASTKTGLTIPEKLIDDYLIVLDVYFNTLITVVNAISNAANSILSTVRKIFKLFGIKVHFQTIPKLNKINLAKFIENRNGMMLLSNDHFNVAKIFILQEGSQSKYNKIHPNNDLLESAKAMWDRFHYVNSFIPAALNSAYSDRPTGNQYLIKILPAFSMNWNEFLQILSNNRVFSATGTEAVVESLKFYPPSPQESGKAEFKVRFSELYTLNLQETFLNPSGA